MACSKSSRAAAPFAGSSRIAGYRPFSSQAWKKNVQSMYRRSSAMRRLDGPQPGERRRDQILGAARRSWCGSRARRESAAAAFAPSRRAGRGAAPARRGSSGRSRSRRPGRAAGRRRRRRVRRRARGPSAASTSGAISTAVCWRDVVAPPISSGRSSPRRSISLATLTISSSDGVIRPERPTASHPSLDGGVEDPCRRAP